MRNELSMEWLCLKQHFHFSLRNRRYLIIAISQYFYSFINWKHAKNLRYTFCTLQLIDDILDGDRTCAIEPIEYLGNLKAAIKSNHFDPSDLQQMTRFTLLRINKLSPFKEEALFAFNELIDVMMDDRLRVLKQTIFNRDRLIAHHHKTFKYSLDIVLIALESKLRTKDLPEILDIFAWSSTIRDLEEDLDKFLINIPLEIIVKIDNFLKLPTSEKIAHREIQIWINEETLKVRSIYKTCEEKLIVLKLEPGVFIFTLFLKSMKKYAINRFQ